MSCQGSSAYSGKAIYSDCRNSFAFMPPAVLHIAPDLACWLTIIEAYSPFSLD